MATNTATARGKRSRQKGHEFEREIVQKLREVGFEHVVSSRAESKKVDDNKIDIIDLDGKLPINIQAKYTQATPSYYSIRDACSDKDKPFCIAWKKSPGPNKKSPGTLALVPIDFFIELLGKVYGGTSAETTQVVTPEDSPPPIHHNQLERLGLEQFIDMFNK